MTDHDAAPSVAGDFRFLAYAAFDRLIDALRSAGYDVWGPCVADGAIVWRPIERADALPQGWHDDQDGGHYRLEAVPDAGWFDYVVGPESIKKFVMPPREVLLELRGKTGGTWEVQPSGDPPRPTALLGVRACDLAALAVQDRIFLEGPYVDPRYAARRRELLLVAVTCRRAARTCFCHSMKTGPEVRGGCDLELREVSGGFLIRAWSDTGKAILADLSLPEADEPREREAADAVARLCTSMAQRDREPSGSGRGRWMPDEDVRTALLEQLTSPHWDAIAKRCLACANCTLVCPTCFCTTIEEVSDLKNEHVMRLRRWESCFTEEHSYTVSGVIHHSTAARYRQWLVHKLATWHDQFGTSGCVGCGRCITWCPVGIDLTEEVARFLQTAKNDS